MYLEKHEGRIIHAVYHTWNPSVQSEGSVGSSGIVDNGVLYAYEVDSRTKKGRLLCLKNNLILSIIETPDIDPEQEQEIRGALEKILQPKAS